ncbi:uncharacterized protein PV09_00428 [Verruconis gallopava]|uniref:Rad21/Rec8-like protein N-terminal domain-containing protein n=1 Tax=Verruconis gallopava TaxID=253628 RepID=A0A0D2ASV1_9PEZI|nr:uncharacterized protein PV09_00428 [Verruconis gallopava]KIW09555.1 hypothetical protein PV09_00428 [Verruconis gallopava]
MFYSHEVLTSRKYGVATIWLVATLGQKSTARKISRRAIQDVDVPKACETIIAPEAPMALRLQSNLLFGISRVYAQQCGYVLSDAQNAQATIRSLLKPQSGMQTDFEAARANSDQINLPDDPAFVPGFDIAALPCDLLDLDNIGAGNQRRFFESASLQTTQSQNHQVVGLNIPQSSSSPGLEAFQLPESGGHGPRFSSLFARDEDDLILPEIDIGIDTDGNFIELDKPNTRPTHGSSFPLLPREADVQNGGHVIGRPIHRNLDAAQINYDQSSPLVDSTLRSPKTPFSSGSYHPKYDVSDDFMDEIMMAAPNRRNRVPKVIPPDKTIELRNRDLLTMSNGYMDRMTADWNRLTNLWNTKQAKLNAEYWLLGRGIANVGDRMGVGGIKTPLADIWSGDNLYLVLTGQERAMKGRKRTREYDNSSPERRIRSRVHENIPLNQGSDDEIMRDYELEVGREEQQPLEDISSAMPWNISASIRGSSVNRTGVGASVAPGSIPGSLTRRGSRLVGASPMVFRGFPGSDFAEGSLPSDPPGFDDIGGFAEDKNSELYRAHTKVGTPVASRSIFPLATLDRESNNFLEFIGNAVEEKCSKVQASDSTAARIMEIEFAELLPPHRNSRVVAAHGLLHVLSLATKNHISVTQLGPFAPIVIEIC